MEALVGWFDLNTLLDTGPLLSSTLLLPGSRISAVFHRLPPFSLLSFLFFFLLLDLFFASLRFGSIVTGQRPCSTTDLTRDRGSLLTLCPSLSLDSLFQGFSRIPGSTGEARRAKCLMTLPSVRYRRNAAMHKPDPSTVLGYLPEIDRPCSPFSSAFSFVFVSTTFRSTLITR